MLPEWQQNIFFRNFAFSIIPVREIEGCDKKEKKIHGIEQKVVKDFDKEEKMQWFKIEVNII